MAEQNRTKLETKTAGYFLAQGPLKLFKSGGGAELYMCNYTFVPLNAKLISIPAKKWGEGMKPPQPMGFAAPVAFVRLCIINCHDANCIFKIQGPRSRSMFESHLGHIGGNYEN